MMILPLEAYIQITLNIWVSWLLFTGAAWLTFLGVRFWWQLVKKALDRD